MSKNQLTVDRLREIAKNFGDMLTGNVRCLNREEVEAFMSGNEVTYSRLCPNCMSEHIESTHKTENNKHRCGDCFHVWQDIGFSPNYKDDSHE